MAFENPQILAESLPRQATIEILPLNRKYLWLSLLTTTIFFIAVAIAAIFLSVFWNTLSSFLFYVLGVWLVLFMFSLLLTFLGFRFKGYALRRHDVVYQSGLLFRSRVTIPFQRVQHCEINEGPIERSFELATLSIYTAGGSSSDIRIPGLLKEEAESMKKLILRNPTADEEE